MAVEVLPAASAAVYVIVYDPIVLVSTVPDEVTVSPPSEVAPASTYVPPSSTVAGLSPLMVITGNTVSGGVDESSVMLSRRTTPPNISNCSTMDNSSSMLARD